MELMKKARDKHFWEKVKNEDSYTFLRDELLKLFNEICLSPIQASKFSEYRIVFESGSRKEFEKGYYDKRKRINILTLLSLIYPENSNYIILLEDALWAVLDEYCWALPAHAKDCLTNDNTLIDLFAAETGITLTEILFFLEDRLSPLIKSRIKTEVNRRIIDSYLTREGEFWWDSGCDNNWAAVCAGSVGAVFLYLRPDLFWQVKPRLDADMERFLSGFYADGVCREGISYWEYGFGFFIFYNDLLRQFTDGKDDCFKDPHIKEIAMFIQKCYLQENVTVSFADGSMTHNYCLGIMHFLKSVYPEIKLPPLKYSYTMDHCARWYFQSRSFIYFNPAYLSDEDNGEKYYYMKDSGWFVRRSPKLAFAAKGGDNDEPHNHNDIGNFIVVHGGRQILCDLGAGEYTRQYFVDSERYKILCNSSFGHSVPSINKEGQKAGKEFFGTMSYDAGILTIDMSKAYGLPTLSSLVRSFGFGDTSIVLKDKISCTEPCELNERFVTLIEPQLLGQSIRIGELDLICDDPLWQASVTPEKHVDHFSNPRTVYCIDFLRKAQNADFELTIRLN